MYKGVSSLLLVRMAQASFHWGGCPDFTDMGQKFNVSNYQGRWYEIVRDQYTTFELTSACVNVDYKWREDGSIQVHNKAVYPYWGWYGLEGSALVSKVDGPASLHVEFYDDPDENRKGNYHVIDTDYVSYSIVYNC